MTCFVLAPAPLQHRLERMDSDALSFSTFVASDASSCTSPSCTSPSRSSSPQASPGPSPTSKASIVTAHCKGVDENGVVMVKFGAALFFHYCFQLLPNFHFQTHFYIRKHFQHIFVCISGPICVCRISHTIILLKLFLRCRIFQNVRQHSSIL